jgi:hypothetical protein
VEAEAVTVVVGTYNAHWRLPGGAVEDDLGRLLSACGVLGLQEMGHRSRGALVRRVCRGRGWRWHRPDDLPHQRQDPLLWDDRAWEAVETGCCRLSAEAEAEDGAGGARITAQWATWVRLRRRRDGLVLSAACWHAPASVQDPRLVRRRAVMAEGSASLAGLARRLRVRSDLTVVVGDMNVDHRRADVRREPGFPTAALRGAGLRPCWDGRKLPALGTHRRVAGLSGPTSGRRLIDYVYADAPALGARVLRGYASDHRPVLARYGA